MSTPSVTILKNLVLNWESNQMEEETIATFYRHYDGYPSCHAIDIASLLVVASRTKPEHIDFSGASVERDMRRSSTLTNTRKSLKGRSAISSRSWRSSRPSVSS